MKILWLDINSSYSHSSLAIPAMDAQLDEYSRQKHSWEIVRGTLKTPANQILEKIYEFNPSIIFSTLWLFNHNSVNHILAKFKKINPHVRIYLGGPEFLGDNEEFLTKNRHINTVFRGDGEGIYKSIINNIEDEQKINDLPGACYINVTGDYKDNNYARIDDFTQLIPPENSDLFEWDKPFVQLETSRGCFNTCSFCISGISCGIQNRDIDEIRTRINIIASKGIREIRILDRTFNANPTRALKLLEIFTSYKGRINFHLEIHPAFLSTEVKQIIKDAPYNSLHLEAGVQSLNRSTINSCQRKGDVESTVEGISFLCSETPHTIHTDLIFGLPYYSYHELIDDSLALMELSPEEIQLESLKVLPGTMIREESSRYRLIYSPTPPYEILCTPWLSLREHGKASTLSMILDLYYNNKEWSHCFTRMAKSNTQFLEEFTDFFHESGLDKSIGIEKKGTILWLFAQEQYPDLMLIIAITWISEGLSANTGPGLMSVQWKASSSTIDNPVYNSQVSNNVYRYIESEGKRFWFLFNRKSNSSKSLINFIQVF
jgi:hypothetical protein